MKKVLFLLLLLLSLSLFTSCKEARDDGKIKVVCSIFPLYDWAQEVVGDSDAVSLDLLVKNGTDMHSYQGSVQDIVAIDECDVFIYVGGESDEWVEEALQNHADPNRVVLRLIDYVECTDTSCHSVIEHSHTHEHEAYDEHIWLSLKNAVRATDLIADVLMALDTEHAAAYAENAEAYTARLNALDEAYAAAFASASQKILLFADRFPFAYLAKDYEIECVAAFSGCSAESGASITTVKELAALVREHSLSAVLVLEDSADSIAEGVIDASGVKNVRILAVNSMQSIDARALASGVSYASVMEKNLEIFRECLH